MYFKVKYILEKDVFKELNCEKCLYLIQFIKKTLKLFTNSHVS